MRRKISRLEPRFRDSIGRNATDELARRQRRKMTFHQAEFRLHHFGYLVPDIEASAGQFVARFGYKIETEVIEDPIQTAYVQFLRLPGAPSWLELIAPNGPNSLLTRALTKGGGFHHLCYEVGDLAGACNKLRSDAMHLLSEPAPAVAFDARPIAWLMDRSKFLVELVEDGPGRLRASSLMP